MILYPAIDIMDGAAVRLRKGDFAEATRYESDPLAAALRWLAEGAEWLHVVDLDGARAGRPRNLAHVARIAGMAGARVQLGGGLRSARAVDEALAAGVERVVLGTAAVGDPKLLAALLEQHGPERVAVAVDARGREVVTEGWERGSGEELLELLERMAATGVRHLIYTEIERDGMLSGPDLQGLEQALRAAEGASLICSGGVGSLEDLKALRALADGTDAGCAAPAGVIVGKALYERRFNVAEALTALG